MTDSPSARFRADFIAADGVQKLTKLLSRFAEHGDHVPDAISLAISAAVAGGSSPSRGCWRVVRVDWRHTVTVRQLPYELAGTGHTLWTAGLLLARWLAAAACAPGGSGREVVAGRTVLELGAGVGLC
jgi:hypothetical protein